MPPSVGISRGRYSEVDGYRHINIFVRFSQEQPDEAPVDLGVVFAFDTAGQMGARRYANLKENLLSPQSTTSFRSLAPAPGTVARTTSVHTLVAFLLWARSSRSSSTTRRR